MNELLLSNRLKTVVEQIPKGSKIADIGSDHAYLPCYAMLQGIITYAVAGEVNEGPYQSAKTQVEKLDLNEQIQVRKGNGLEVVTNGEVEVIVIAGMGGPLITEILDAGKEKLANVQRLILQPNIGAIHIRNWLIENEWELVNEHILEEDGKIYEILVAERGSVMKPYLQLQMNAALMLGPFLMIEKNEAFIKKWTFELTKWREVKDQLESATINEETLQRKQLIEEKIIIVKGVIES